MIQVHSEKKGSAFVLLALFCDCAAESTVFTAAYFIFFPAYPYAGTRWKISPAPSWKLCLLKSSTLIPLDLITTWEAEINLNWDDCEAESGSLWEIQIIFIEIHKRERKNILNKLNILKFKADAEDVKLFWVKTIFCDCLTGVSRTFSSLKTAAYSQSETCFFFF